MNWRRVSVIVVVACSAASIAFLSSTSSSSALTLGSQEEELTEQQIKDQRRVQALMRLDEFDLSQHPEVKDSVQRYLERVEGTEEFLMIVEKLKLTEASDYLLNLAAEHPDEAIGIESIKALFRMGQRDQVRESIDWPEGDEVDDATSQRIDNLMTAIGRAGNRSCVAWLIRAIEDSSRPVASRNQAVRALGKSRAGENALLEKVQAGSLDDRLSLTAADVLHASVDGGIRETIGKLMPLPEAAGSEPLPPTAELAKMKGDIKSGRQVFGGAGTCAKCHQVLGAGKNVGPDLSEIGDKLSREAMYESILNPSAGISHNYESYAVVTIDGTIVNGVLVSKTDNEVVLKDAEAIEHRLATADIEEMAKQPVSIMPTGLQKDMTKQQLVDLVEFLMSLKKAADSE